MKKNLIAIVILALVITNLILTVVLTFSILPASQKTDKMVSQICSILDIELGQDAESAAEKVPMDKVATYPIPDQMTINLKPGEDGKAHIIMLTVTLSMNKDDKDYKTYGSEENLAAQADLIKDRIIKTVGSFTYEEVIYDIQAVQDATIEAIQEMYDSKFIINVAFKDVTYQ